ncbi:hypothetical protein JTB14_028148 [Gonioctena quinquepunctata]|nr:hypothetical protein JTB14_028148 [Gonioctena quinquepunctata]
MIDEIPEDIKTLPFKFYFDNFFTNLNLLFNLKQKGYDGIGTMRDNRVPKSFKLPQKKQIAKTKKWGDEEDEIILVKWMNNNSDVYMSWYQPNHSGETLLSG